MVSSGYIRCGFSSGELVANQLTRLGRKFADIGPSNTSRTRNLDSLQFQRLARNVDDNVLGKTSHGSFRRRRRRKLEIKQTPLRPTLSKYIDEEFERLYYAFTEYDGRSFSFNCNSQLTNMVKQEFPRSVFRFVHNDKPMSKTIGLYSGVLRFRKLNSKNEGVYLCQMEYEKNLVKTFALFTLLIKNSKDEIVRVRETESLSLACHSTPMSHFYPKSTRIWRNHNNKPKSKKYPANKSNNDTFTNVKRSNRGTWICWVEDKRSARKWPIAWYRVYIDPPPTDNDKLIMSIQRNIMLVIGFVIGTLGLLCVMCFSLLYRGNSPLTIDEEDVEILDERDVICDLPPAMTEDVTAIKQDTKQRTSQLKNVENFGKERSLDRVRSFHRECSIEDQHSFIFSDKN